MPTRTTKYPPNTLVNLQKVDVYAATYVDGQQVADTRFVAVVGDNIHFLHPEGVDSKIRQPAGWVKDAIRNRLPKEEVTVPDDAVSDLPMEEAEVPEDNEDLPDGLIA